MPPTDIIIQGAREHNLKNIDVVIPRGKLVVITGLSGSGKSSLAFDTIYAEGQRRYVESLSAYARQFLGLMEKPDVDFIDGLSPAISIEQRSSARNPRSTVGTVTEIHDYLRLLYARIGIPHCYKCGKPITQQTVQQIADTILEYPANSRIQVLAPLVRGRKGEYREIFDSVKREGFVRMRVDGAVHDIEEAPPLDKKKKHSIEVVVDRLVVKNGVRKRLTDSLEIALKMGNGLVIVDHSGRTGDLPGRGDTVYSEQFACQTCGISYEEPQPRMFSFNSPFGACPVCSGLGYKMEIDPDLVVPDKNLSIAQGAIAPWGVPRGNYYFGMIRAVAEHYGINLRKAFKDLPEKSRKTLLFGSGREEIKFAWERSDGKGTWENYDRFEGVIGNLRRRYRQTDSEGVREWIERFMSVKPCEGCGGARLKKEALAVKIDGKSIAELSALPVKRSDRFFENLRLDTRQRTIARQILKEVKERLGFLVNVGLDYLTLDRSAQSLSGGEAQRIRLATQIGSRLTGVLYILDEPSIGLHQRDNKRLLNTLTSLRDIGNTVLVVEHDRQTIESADYVIDLGPGAGKNGGTVVAAGTPAEIMRSNKSLTGKYLSGKLEIPVPAIRRKGVGQKLLLRGARGNNLKNVDVEFPLGKLICITGVSGSGKSTLVNETLYRILSREFYGSKSSPLSYDEVVGLKHIDKVIDIDQSPIGRTPRSNPATYTGLFTPIRDLFASIPEAKVRGYGPGRFSFNVRGGRCEVCEGDGIIKIEMHFLPDVYVQCEECKGARYNRDTLEIKYRGKSISDVLDMTVDEALEFFERIPRIKRKLETLANVGLGYIHLGQQATTLSGGEAQRVKLSTELSKVATGNTFYILDEPTTGLHFEDIKMLLIVLNTLVERGNTVVVIEHNLEVIKTADWIIDLGPEGGDDGGQVVATGTPEQVAKCETSYTGQFLRKELRL
ncbi:MAG: excinuclease ABC subunit A [candidate division Zixibacteria bacterium RBG_16_53_22]|nr:MAG: excinuclease ABC subunit A [candidate division Zixibacteria bacterium RBG_16_53_22]